MLMNIKLMNIMKFKFLLTAAIMTLLVADMSVAFAGDGDHILFYKGMLHLTDLTGRSPMPPDQLFILKIEILPSKKYVHRNGDHA
jgi:hypothetical protein